MKRNIEANETTCASREPIYTAGYTLDDKYAVQRNFYESSIRQHLYKTSPADLRKA